MKKIITLVILLVVLTSAVGCSQKGKGAQTTASDKTKTTTDTTKDNGTSTAKNESTELFGIPMKTEDYSFRDLRDLKNERVQYYLEQLDKVFGMEGYLLSGMTNSVNSGEEGDAIHFYAQESEAFAFKSIKNEGGVLSVVLSKVQPGSPYAQDKAYLVVRKPFTSIDVHYEDGTKARNIGIFADEVGLLKNKGLFQEVKGNKVLIIPEGSTLSYAYTMDGVTAEAFKDFKKGDEIEFMNGTAKDMIYSARLAQK